MKSEQPHGALMASLYTCVPGASGFVAGSIGVLVGNPFDTIRVRMAAGPPGESGRCLHYDACGFKKELFELVKRSNLMTSSWTCFYNLYTYGVFH